MNILLDTHILLWAVADSNKLSDKATELLEDGANGLFCSVASLWEIAIKSTLSRSDFQIDIPKLRHALPDMAIQELPVTGTHTEQLIQLPIIHNDPFDRMLIAQSIAEPLTFITRDKLLQSYSNGIVLV